MTNSEFVALPDVAKSKAYLPTLEWLKWWDSLPYTESVVARDVAHAWGRNLRRLGLPPPRGTILYGGWSWQDFIEYVDSLKEGMK
jgi:hypothetical protein